MSTEKSNITQRRFAELARLGEQVFHASDLAVLWRISKPNTLYTTLKRYTDAGLLFRVFKGLYAIKPPKDIDSLLLGIKVLHRFAYVSTETVLARHGIILQDIHYITIISSLSKRFKAGGNDYRCRRLTDRFLYQKIGIEVSGGINIAAPERAVADMLHFQPNYHLDNRKAVDWPIVKKLQLRLGYRLPSKNYVIAE